MILFNQERGSCILLFNQERGSLHSSECSLQHHFLTGNQAATQEIMGNTVARLCSFNINSN
jgi:hypothetical protein